jgi:hypothetical protein
MGSRAVALNPCAPPATRSGATHSRRAGADRHALEDGRETTHARCRAPPRVPMGQQGHSGRRTRQRAERRHGRIHSDRNGAHPECSPPARPHQRAGRRAGRRSGTRRVQTVSLSTTSRAPLGHRVFCLAADGPSRGGSAPGACRPAPRRRAVLPAQAARLRTAGHRGLRDPVDRDALEAVLARLLGMALGPVAFSAPRHAASG